MIYIKTILLVEDNPAVILLDIKMPRMDGIDVLKIIRNDPALKRIPADGK